MGTSKVAITLDEELLERIDRLVAERKFPSRSRAIQLAVKAQIDRLDRRRLARECQSWIPSTSNSWQKAAHPTTSNHGQSTEG